jgi:hypothetical protein
MSSYKSSGIMSKKIKKQKMDKNFENLLTSRTFSQKT